MAGMTRDEYMAKWHPEDEMKTNAWLLTVGEYDDYHVIGVVVGLRSKAREIAERLTIERAKAGEPSDMTVVSIEKREVFES